MAMSSPSAKAPRPGLSSTAVHPTAGPAEGRLKATEGTDTPRYPSGSGESRYRSRLGERHHGTLPCRSSHPATGHGLRPRQDPAEGRSTVVGCPLCGLVDRTREMISGYESLARAGIARTPTEITDPPRTRLKVEVVVEGPKNRLAVRTDRRRVRLPTSGPHSGSRRASVRTRQLPSNRQPPGEAPGLQARRPLPRDLDGPQEPSLHLARCRAWQRETRGLRAGGSVACRSCRCLSCTAVIRWTLDAWTNTSRWKPGRSVPVAG